jgi:hypothetical protein
VTVDWKDAAWRGHALAQRDPKRVPLHVLVEAVETLRGFA